MNELLVNSHIQLFAHITLQSDKAVQHLAEIYTEVLFTRILNAKIGKEQKIKLRNLISEKKKEENLFEIGPICSNLNKNTSIQQRLLLLINLLEFGLFVQKNAILLSKSDSLFALIQDISDYLNIPKSNFNLINSFVSGKLYEIQNRTNILVVKSQNPNLNGTHFIKNELINGYFVFVYLSNIQVIFFRYFGDEHLTHNSKNIQPNSIYSFQSGSVISLNGKPIIYYSDIISKFKGLSDKDAVILNVKNVEFTYPKSKFGIHNLSFSAKSGELIGVMGGSGVGKSTLFNILNGSFEPNKGSISLNGVNYTDELDKIQQLIGFVPQDDSLFENLTVYENLFYTAQLAIGNISSSQTNEIVNARLSEFGLYAIKDLKVGSSLSRNISGGQRKRLNIVTEIIREPKILLVDEPTSGLSSADSLRVMSLLKEQALTGRLVVVNIHQPSSEIYRLFDKILVLDEGGFMVFYGNPLEAVRYFKTQAKRIDADEVECSTCHNIKSDEIFDIIAEKKVDELGQITEVRKVKPVDWSSRFKPKDIEIETTKELPKISSSKASIFKQLRVFLTRLTLTKLRDVEFFIFAFVIPVLLATVIALFSKYTTPTETGDYVYVFYENYNIPIFFLTSIISCMFLGMIVTSDSIIKDANVNKREAFLFLSRKAYYNSKVVFYFGLTIIQTLIYTGISVLILQIKGMFLEIWLVMLLMGFFGNIAGLIVSTIFKSLSAAYLIVPFLVIPQIILSGITIPFERMNNYLSHPEYVPVIGLVSPSMWGMEALLVYQYQNNEYEKNFFAIDFIESQARIQSQYLIPKLIQFINRFNDVDDNSKKRYLKLIKNGCAQLGIKLDDLSTSKEQKKLIVELKDLQKVKQKNYSLSLRKKDKIYTSLIKKYGNNENVLALKNTYTNKGVEDLTLARKNITAIKIVEDRIVQTIDPIFKIPTSKWGRAHFLAPYKRLGNNLFNTFQFNTAILFIFLTAIYLLLIFDIFPKAIKKK
jgi:ABC-type multidrug transport system ATPase subunit